MGRIGKKIALVLGIIASILVIGTSVSGWIKDAQDKNTDPAPEQTAAVAVITE